MTFQTQDYILSEQPQNWKHTLQKQPRKWLHSFL